MKHVKRLGRPPRPAQYHSLMQLVSLLDEALRFLNGLACTFGVTISDKCYR